VAIVSSLNRGNKSARSVEITPSRHGDDLELREARSLLESWVKCA
jgi:hypothetical protein